MSVRNFDKLFTPRSVALIGATPRPSSVGAVVARNLRRAGFAGELTLVNPHHHAIDGLTVHPDVASLPQAPGLAIIVTPPDTVPGLVGELGERGTRAAVVITAGFWSSAKRAAACSRPCSMQQSRTSCTSSGRTVSASWSRDWGSTLHFLIWQHRRGISPSSANRVR
jgi:acetyltransferase